MGVLLLMLIRFFCFWYFLILGVVRVFISGGFEVIVVWE